MTLKLLPGGWDRVGLANRAASIAAFGCTSLSLVDWPCVHVTIYLSGIFAAATAR